MQRKQKKQLEGTAFHHIKRRHILPATAAAASADASGNTLQRKQARKHSSRNYSSREGNERRQAWGHPAFNSGCRTVAARKAFPEGRHLHAIHK